MIHLCQFKILKKIECLFPGHKGMQIKCIPKTVGVGREMEEKNREVGE